MRLTILADNNTLIDVYYLGEPGLSILVEEGNNKILFDLGYSDVFMRNAYKMGIDLREVNRIVLSHGHLDHTWGLISLMENMEASTYKDSGRRIKLLTHPAALDLKMDEGEPIGFIYSQAALTRCFEVQLSRKPVWLSEKLVYLGEIERTNKFENQEPIGTTVINGVEQQDYLPDDSALAYKSEKGLVIITGCSHSGICNIIEHAKKICQEDKVADIVGGFHLLAPSAEQLAHTLEYMGRLEPEQVHACHCTDLHSKIALAQAVNLKEVGVGLTLEYE